MRAVIPEARSHKRDIAASNAALREWNLDWEEAQRLCGIVRSHMVSAGEAAWREDGDCMKAHLLHAREALILCLKLTK